MAESTKKRTYTKKTTSTQKAPDMSVTAAEIKVDETATAEIPVVPAAVEAAKEELAEKFVPAAAPEAPQSINMYVEQKAPPVKILYIDSCIPNNQIPIGNGRMITGSGRIFSVPMEQFEGEFMTPLTMKLIDIRKFIVLSGLTEEQRYQYNCHYDEGEVVKNEGTFDMLFSMPTPQAVNIFSNLCPEHQRLVATRFITAYFEKHDNRITRDKAEALNKASKATDADGLFTPIVKDFNDKNT